MKAYWRNSFKQWLVKRLVEKTLVYVLGIPNKTEQQYIIYSCIYASYGQFSFSIMVINKNCFHATIRTVNEKLMKSCRVLEGVKPAIAKVTSWVWQLSRRYDCGSSQSHSGEPLVSRQHYWDCLSMQLRDRGGINQPPAGYDLEMELCPQGGSLPAPQHLVLGSLASSAIDFHIFI